MILHVDDNDMNSKQNTKKNVPMLSQAQYSLTSAESWHKTPVIYSLKLMWYVYEKKNDLAIDDNDKL